MNPPNSIVIAIIIVIIFFGSNTRAILTDGLNSAAHVIFGAISYNNDIIAYLFLMYQLAQYVYGCDNTSVDVLEFVVGWALAAMC